MFPHDWRWGVLAFALVMVAELALAVLLFGQSPAQHLDAYRHFAGLAGLAAQLAYALFPALRRGVAGPRR